MNNKTQATAEAQSDLTAFTPTFNDFFCSPSTDFADFLAEADNLAAFSPGILERVRLDLQTYGLEKKRIREAEQRFVIEQTATLEGFDNAETAKSPAELETGRPGMPAEMVYLFLLIRGFLGSTTTLRTVDRLRDSRALDVWLGMRGWTMPARTTIYENLNAVSEATIDYIHQQHLEMVKKEGLDDFLSNTIDSTSVEANSSWPTDSGIIHGLLTRACRIGHSLEKFDLKAIPQGKLGVWMEELEGLPFQISLAAKKQKEMKKLYLRLCIIAAKMTNRLMKDFGRLSKQWTETLNSGNYSPLAQMRAKAAIDELESSINGAATTIQQTHQRIFEGQTTKATKRILSLNDSSAAFIQKGGREPVIGYKPQLCRSANGFVTYVGIPEGNAADSAQFVPAIKGSIELTGVIPEIVSADDGYASGKALDEIKNLGVNIVSISGSKGKRLLEEVWHQEDYSQIRRDRSAVESLMFCLKHSFYFGSVGRTGIEAVRQELKEKVLAYNLSRSVYWRQKKRQEEESPQAA